MEKKLFKDLKQSLSEAVDIKRGRHKASRITKFDAVDIRRLRKQVDVSQARFAGMLGVSERTLQNWEQGRRSPRGPAKALLKVFSKDPKAVIKALG